MWQCTRRGARKPFINAGWVALVGMVAALLSDRTLLGIFVGFVTRHVRELAQRQPARRTDVPLHHLCSMTRCAVLWSVCGLDVAARARAFASATLVLRRLASEVWVRIAIAVATSLPHGATRTTELQRTLGTNLLAESRARRRQYCAAFAAVACGRRAPGPGPAQAANRGVSVPRSIGAIRRPSQVRHREPAEIPRRHVVHRRVGAPSVHDFAVLLGEGDQEGREVVGIAHHRRPGESG